MTKNELKDRYFNWMYQLVYPNRYSKRLSYVKLLFCLDNIEFISLLPMDDNRAADGMDLRYRFGFEKAIPLPIIAEYLDDRKCSMLEMMVALSNRCEEQIMDNPDVGNRTSRWFWEMIDSLGLSDMDDENFDEEKVRDTVYDFLNRNYEPDGKGGLFIIKNNNRDLRTVEIWCQMCWYLNDILEREGG